MSARRMGLKRSYALFIILLMVLGIVAGAFYFYHPDCGGPSNALFSKVYQTFINGQAYNAVNANFTGKQPENFVFSGVTFLTVSFSDPSLSHPVSFVCGVDNTTPASIRVEMTFSSDGAVELLPNATSTPMEFKGSINQQVGPLFSQHVNPTAGVVWYPNTPWIVLLVSCISPC